MAGQWEAIQDLQARVDKLEGKKSSKPAAARPPRKKPAPKAS